MLGFRLRGFQGPRSTCKISKIACTCVVRLGFVSLPANPFFVLHVNVHVSNLKNSKRLRKDFFQLFSFFLTFCFKPLFSFAIFFDFFLANYCEFKRICGFYAYLIIQISIAQLALDNLNHCF